MVASRVSVVEQHHTASCHAMRKPAVLQEFVQYSGHALKFSARHRDYPAAVRKQHQSPKKWPSTGRLSPPTLQLDTSRRRLPPGCPELHHTSAAQGCSCGTERVRCIRGVMMSSSLMNVCKTLCSLPPCNHHWKDFHGSHGFHDQAVRKHDPKLLQLQRP